MVRLKVKEIAQQKKMSMRKLAKEADIAYNTLRTIYRNPYRQVTTFTLDKLAKALKVDASELIESIPDNKPDTPTDSSTE
jgi:DNA-binding Xre family transcriptional regulator